MEAKREDELLREKFIHMAEELEPAKETKERIWDELSETGNVHRPFSVVKAASVAIVAVLVIAGGSFSVNAATGGRFFESIAEASRMDGNLFAKIKYVCGNKEHIKQVAEETLTMPNMVYAPELSACSDDYIIFANERGLMVYDRKQEGISAALDLQELGCNYLNADTIETCIFMEQDMLYIFNKKKESKQSGNVDEDNGEVTMVPELAYTYKLSMAGEEDALGMIEDALALSGLKQSWLRYRQASIRDTFDEMQEHVIDLNELAGHSDTCYSEDCILWTGEDGTERESFLVVTDDGKYVLYTRNMTDNSLGVQELMVAVEASENGTGETESQGLPAFVYTGDDEIVRALCVEALKEEEGFRTPGSVFIPVPYVHETVNDGDDVIVFCDLTAASYYQNGNTLNCESGGSVPSRIRLTPDGAGGYKVTEHLAAEDGEGYIESIEAFCREYGVSPDVFMNDGDGEQVRKAFIKMYVKDNQLPIKYYKDYGWDPIAIEEDE